MIFLASRSPRRADLLRRAGIPFQTIEAPFDEDAIQLPHPQALVLERARGKARAGIVPPDIEAVVAAADTVAALGTEIFGKPRDADDARRILARLSGTTHSVFTGICCLRRGTDGAILAEAAAIASARVTFRPLTPADIDAYVASGESDNKAGAYAIQETGDRFVADLQGSWDTVVGLNLATLARLYREVADTPLPGWNPDAATRPR